MPIAIQCTGCKQRLRVPDKAAGKRVKCPKCQTILRIPILDEQQEADDVVPQVQKQPVEPQPAEESATRPTSQPQSESQQPAVKTEKDPESKQPVASQPAAEHQREADSKVTESKSPQQKKSRKKQPTEPRTPEQPLPTEQDAAPTDTTETRPDRWYLKTEDGEDYGPVPKAELDQWMGEGRITADCHVLQDGAEQWQWASDVYPQLEAAEEATAPAGPPPLKISSPSATAPASPTIPAPATTPGSSPAITPDAFQFAAADTSPTLRARGRKRVRKVVKKGASTGSVAPVAAVKTPRPTADGTSPKSKLTAGLLGIFLGGYGVHRFYLGYTGMGLLMLFTCGGCGIWSLIDAIMVLLGKVPDAQGRPLRD